MNDLEKLVDVDLIFGGSVNGTPIDCVGRSRGRFGDGNISAVVDAQEPLPAGMHISLLSYVALTGQPSMSRVVDGAVNPFIGTGGVYAATRTLDVGVHGSLVTTYRVESAGPNRLAAVFDVQGEVDVPRLIAIHPTIETWTPVGPGMISGQFTMVWACENESIVQGKADTSYSLPTGQTIPGQQFREIRIHIDSTPSRLIQNEHIVLFAPKFLENVLHSTTKLADSPYSSSGSRQ